MKKWIIDNKKYIVFTIYSLFTLALLLFHENWRDEAQAWLIARDCNILEFFNVIKHEGHLILWYIVLLPFAKLGFPFVTINIISWLITCISAWLILDKAPFKFYKRVLLIFTFPFLYLYPVVARCYCLIPLAIILMAIFYKERKEKPIRYLLSVVMLANTHVIMLGMVGIVLLEYLIEFIKDWKKHTQSENKKILECFIITIVLLVLSMLPLLGCITANKDVTVSTNILPKLPETVFYYPFIIVLQTFRTSVEITTITGIVAITIMVLLFFEIKNRRLEYFKIFICIVWQCLIYSFVYESSYQRAASIIFIVLYYKWVSSEKERKHIINNFDKRAIEICWVILAIINIYRGLLYIKNYEVIYSCSNAYEMARYINNNIEGNSVILNGPRVEFTSSVVAYAKKDIKFYYIGGKRYFSYAIWNDENSIELKLEDIENLKNIFSKDQKLYFIYCTDKYRIKADFAKIDERNLINECIQKGIFKQLYSTDRGSLYAENFIIYEVLLNNLE